jgi:phospholipase/carboxylesterase
MPDYELIHQGQSINNASKALLLLHGRGGSAQDMLGLAKEFSDDSFYIAALQAPNNTWYPQSLMAEEKINEPYLSSSIEAVKKLIDQTAKHIPRDKIYLMGFSQGACLALETTARNASKYGGVVAFSGALIGSTLNEKNIKATLRVQKYLSALAIMIHIFL